MFLCSEWNGEHARSVILYMASHLTCRAPSTSRPSTDLQVAAATAGPLAGHHAWSPDGRRAEQGRSAACKHTFARRHTNLCTDSFWIFPRVTRGLPQVRSECSACLVDWLWLLVQQQHCNPVGVWHNLVLMCWHVLPEQHRRYWCI